VLPVFQDLDVAAMREAAERTLGRRDFAAFATRETRSTERTVLMCELRERDREIELHVAADGFLRTMVRTLVGSLLWVGSGYLTVDSFEAMLAAGDRRRAGRNVRPHGLYFVEAGYGPWDAARSEAAFARVDPR
jgi:tRNA pseudouridine38-40 synthase